MPKNTPKPAPIEDKSKRKESLTTITVGITADTFKDTTTAPKRDK